jgi:hypothetical protein
LNEAQDEVRRLERKWNKRLKNNRYTILKKYELAKRRARGYRNPKNFIKMIYFLCEKLKFDFYYPYKTL